MNNRRSTNVNNQLRSTTFSYWENDYARQSQRSPPPLQSILRRHHTTATADYSFQQRANAADHAGDRGSRHVVIRSAYRPRDPTSVRSEANDGVGRNADRKTIVRFSGDVDDQSTRQPGRISIDDKQSSFRTRMNTDGEMLGLTNGMRKLMTRSRSVSDVQLYREDRQQPRIHGRDVRPPAKFTALDDTGREHVAFATDTSLQGTQRPHSRKWSSFLMKVEQFPDEDDRTEEDFRKVRNRKSNLSACRQLGRNDDS